MEATITSKGQVTLPKVIRERLNLKAGDRIEFLLDESGGVRVVPLTSPVTILKGMVPKPDRPRTLDEMDGAVRRHAVRR